MLLDPVLEVLYELIELRPPSVMADIVSTVQPAGKAINIAKVVRQLGEQVCVVGVMPENAKAQFTNYLEHLQIGSAFYSIEGNVRINATIVEKMVNQCTHIGSRALELSPYIQKEIFSFIQKYFDADDTWVFSGNAPIGFTDDVYFKLIEQCKTKAFTTVLDTKGRPLQLGLRAKPDMIKPNLTELEEVFGEEISGIHHIALKGKRLIDMGIRYVFISLGSDGLIAIHGNDCLLCSGPSYIKAVDTKGSGDALVAGLIVGYQKKYAFAEMCRLAVACGASKAMHFGCGNIDRDEVWELMEDVRIEAV